MRLGLGKIWWGSGANFRYAYVFVWRVVMQVLSGEDRGPNFRGGGYFFGEWFEVELLFFSFRRQLNAADRHDRRRALAAGFDRHLTKPVNPGVLEALLADFVKQEPP